LSTPVRSRQCAIWSLVCRPDCGAKSPNLVPQCELATREPLLLESGVKSVALFARAADEREQAETFVATPFACQCRDGAV